MKIRIRILLCTGLIAGVLTGCGGKYETMPVGTGEGISGEAVSGQAVTEEETETDGTGGHCYHTDTNLYRDSYGNVVIQTRLDSSHGKKIKLKGEGCELITIRDNNLYYLAAKHDPDGDDISTSIFRVPIGKDSDGYDEVRTKQAEELMNEPSSAEFDEVCVTSQYIYWFLDSSSSIIKYDLQQKKEVPVNDLETSERTPEIEFVPCGNHMVAISAEEGLFVQNMDDTEWAEVSDNEEIAWNNRAFNEKYFFYTGDYGYEENIRKVDLSEKSEEAFVTKKQLRQAVAGALGINAENDSLEVCSITDLFCQTTRCYVQVQANWMQEDVYHMAYLILSQGQDETELTYEKELTECMWSHGTARKGKWMNQTLADHMVIDEWVCQKHVLLNESKCYRIINGKAYLYLYDKEKGKGRVGCYELEKGEFRWLSKKDAEYYEPCYTDPNDYDTLMEYYYNPEDVFTGVYWSPNPFDEEQDGGFKDEDETKN